MARTGNARLTADDWIGAALAAMGRGGVRAVSVEALAAELGASKGSFYWFFSNREALVIAALERWQESTTRQLASGLDAMPDAETRLRGLVRITFADSPWRGIEVALQADLDIPLVRQILAQVDQRRLTILQELHTTAGRDTVDSRRAALSGYATWLGFLQLQRTDPDLVLNDAERAAYLESLLGNQFGSHASHGADKP